MLENRQGTTAMTVTVQGAPLRVNGLPHRVHDATVHVMDVGGAVSGRRGMQPGRARARLWCTPPQEQKQQGQGQPRGHAGGERVVEARRRPEGGTAASLGPVLAVSMLER